MSLSDVLEKMHAGYGFGKEVGIGYFYSYLSELSEWRFPEIMRFQVQNYPQRYVLDFTLSTPALWRDLPVDAWIEVMRLNNPRPDSRKLFGDEGFYSDIYFLFKYVRVNALELYLKQESFAVGDKIEVIGYCRKESSVLLPDEVALEDLDGDYFVSLDEIETLRSRLNIEFGLSDQHLDERSLAAYIDRMEEVYR